ncbi:MAG: hypothetical protein ACLR2E_01140 [Lachnospiraceae bacterium]
MGQVPVHYNAYSTGRPVTPENAGERFHSRYIDIPNQPLYSFGYGLSCYTDFEISGITLDREEMKASETIHASVTVKNTGDREGHRDPAALPSRQSCFRGASGERAERLPEDNASAG